MSAHLLAAWRHRLGVRYQPEPGAPEGGEWVYDGPLMPIYNTPEPRWSQDHHRLVEDALHSWKGDPISVSTHLNYELRDAPQPDSGSGKQMRAWAGALLWEMRNAKTVGRQLYRGEKTSRIPQEGDVINWVLRGASSNKATAKRFAGLPNVGGERPMMYVIEPGARALKISDYWNSGLDQSEQEYLLSGDFRILHVDITQTPWMIRVEQVNTEPRL